MIQCSGKFPRTEGKKVSITCGNCGGQYDDDANFCPHCGAENPGRKIPAELPKTIDGLKEFCAAHGLPLEQMRFFIGEDRKEPKAFGIFRNSDGQFTVYKNKADGSRAVRYQGYDEAYAVNEIVQKMKSEIALRRRGRSVEQSAPAMQTTQPDRVRSRLRGLLIAVLVIAALLYILGRGPDTGYYRYQDDMYYCRAGDWFLYSIADDYWYPAADIGPDLVQNYEDYWYGGEFGGDYGVSSFEDIERDYYPSSDANEDWDDNDWDWDGGDWDSSSTDWGSDW